MSDDYEIKVTDTGWRPLDGAQIAWELDGHRPVHVRAVYTEDRYEENRYSTQPWVRVEISDSDECWPHAILVLPENGKSGGMRAEVIPAFLAAVARATEIMAVTDERLAAARAEYEAAGGPEGAS